MTSVVRAPARRAEATGREFIGAPAGGRARGNSHAGDLWSARSAVHPPERGVHFLDRQYHRQALRALGPLQVLRPRRFGLQNAAVPEEQRGQRLVVSGGGDQSLGGEHRQTRLDVGRSNLVRMATGVEADEITQPVDVGVLRIAPGREPAAVPLRRLATTAS